MDRMLVLFPYYFPLHIMYALIQATTQIPAFQVNRKSHISIRLLMAMVRRIHLHLGFGWLMGLKK